MQNILPDLKICQEARDKGIKIESKFWWIKLKDKRYKERWYASKYEDDYNPSKDLSVFVFYPAPLTDEILKVLPDIIEEDQKYILTITKEGDEYGVCYQSKTLMVLSETIFIDKKLSNALLMLAITLKKDNII